MKQFGVICFLFSFLIMTAKAEEKINIADLSVKLFSVQGDAKRPIIDKLVFTNDRSLIPTFVLAMRWTGDNKFVADALSKLAGEKITTWHEAYQWQERHPEIIPHETYRPLKLRFLGNTDKRFLDIFKPPYGGRSKMKIRLEEISWGGALYDGIPSLDKPAMILAEAADYMLDDDLVFGVEINGDVRAYPLRIMGWHEMFNDVIGGVPVALAYCTLCGAGILFETAVEDRVEPFVFGSSGLLYRSNKLMFDRQTNTIWNQFTGEPVIGPLVDSEINLKIRPVSITTWAAWKETHPKSKILSLNTGYSRDYGSGVVYRDYFASSDLMFPAVVGDESILSRKDYIFGIRETGAAKAWPIEAFRKTQVINDRVGVQNVVLVGDAATRTVRAYQRKPDEIFEKTGSGLVSNSQEEWRITEDFLILPDKSEKRARIPGHVSYWFAWDNYLGVKSELYTE